MSIPCVAAGEHVEPIEIEKEAERIRNRIGALLQLHRALDLDARVSRALMAQSQDEIDQCLIGIIPLEELAAPENEKAPELREQLRLHYEISDLFVYAREMSDLTVELLGLENGGCNRQYLRRSLALLSEARDYPRFLRREEVEPDYFQAKAALKS